MDVCLNDDQLQEIVDGITVPSLVAAHLHRCRICAGKLDLLKARATTQSAQPTLTRDSRPMPASSEFMVTPEPRERADSPLPDNIFPGYEVIRELGHGGQGSVFLAIQKATRSKVAIKVLRDGVFSSPAMRERFKREVEIAAQLRDHSNIVTIYDSGLTSDGRQFYVMDYIAARPLNRYVRETRPTIEAALGTFSMICSAVHFAHERGIIHRDLKPSNILVDTNGNPRILDFGLAKSLSAPSDAALSSDQAVMGTLPYLSPEQASGSDQLDRRTDVYSLGIVLYELLTGGFPYEVRDAMPNVVRRILEQQPTAPRKCWDSSFGITRSERRSATSTSCPIDDELETIVLTALAKERERRYQSAESLREDVERYVRGERITAKKPDLLYLARVKLRRHKALVLVGAIFALIVAGLVWKAVAASAVAAAAARHAALVKNATDLLLKRTNPTDDPEIARILDEAERALPGDGRANFLRGRLYSMHALAAPRAERLTLAARAIGEFERSNAKAGGMPFASTPAGGDPRGGDAVSLWAASDIATLLGDFELAIKLQKAARTGAFASDVVLGRPPLVRTYQQDEATDATLRDDRSGDRPRPGVDVIISDATVNRLMRGKLRLNPYDVNAPAQFLAELVYEPLFVLSTDLSVIPNPGLVASVAHNAGSALFDLELHARAAWHDGAPLTAADVAFSYAEFGTPEQRAHLTITFDDPRGKRVRFTHDRARGVALHDMMLAIVPKHLVEPALADIPADQMRYQRLDVARERLDPAARFVGNGAYRVTRFDDTTAEFLRFDDYAGWSTIQRDKLEYAIKRFVFHTCDAQQAAAQRNEARLKWFESTLGAAEGELTVDGFRLGFNGASFADRYVKISRNRRAFDYIAWNVSREGSPVVSPEVRRALAMAIDVESLREQCYDDVCKPFRGIWQLADTNAAKRPSELPTYDLEAARKVLSGKQLKLTLALPENSPSVRRAAICIAEMLAAAGVEMQLQEVPNASVGNLRGSTYDCGFKSVIGNVHPYLDAIRWRTDGERNDTGWGLPELDQLFNQAADMSDPASARQRYREIEQMIHQSQPYLFLWSKPSLWAISRNLRGVEFSAYGPHGVYPGPRAWWVAAR